MLTESALKNPAGVAAAVTLVVLLGALSLNRLPIQLFPDLSQPQISIQTTWRTASPKEIESEIVEPIESVLQGVPGLKEMSRVRKSRRRIHQPELRDRYRHAADAGGRDRPHEPPAAATAGCEPACDHCGWRWGRDACPDLLFCATATRQRWGNQ